MAAPRRTPGLETLSLFLPALDDEPVEVSFIDEGQSLLAFRGKGVTAGYTLVTAVIGNSFAAIRIAKCLANVSGAKPRFTSFIAVSANLLRFKLERNYLSSIHGITLTG